MKNLFIQSKQQICGNETASPAQVRKAMLVLALIAAAGAVLLLSVAYKHFKHMDGVGKLRVVSSSGEIIAVSKPSYRKAILHKPQP